MAMICAPGRSRHGLRTTFDASGSAWVRASEVDRLPSSTIGDQANQPDRHGAGPYLAAQRGEVTVAELTVEERIGTGGLARPGLGLLSTEKLGDEILDRIEIFQARGFEDVRHHPRVETGLARAPDLVDPGGGNHQAYHTPGPAILSDLAKPVLRFFPVTFALEHLEQIPEIIGEEAEDDEMRAKLRVVLLEGVVLLLGRVAQMTGIQHLRPLLEPCREHPLQAFAGRLIVADEQALHVRVAQHETPERCVRVGVRARAGPQELIVCTDESTTSARSP